MAEVSTDNPISSILRAVMMSTIYLLQTESLG